jgi:glucosamine kinase
MVDFLIGVDGGGSGTRALLARPDGVVLSQGEAGPSALGQGIEPAWVQVQEAVRAAFSHAGLAAAPWAHCGLAAGLSGANNAPWYDAFIAQNPGFGRLLVETDSFVMLVGAHAGRPGAIVAAGTGAIGEVWRADGSRSSANGWGFPVGDEGSGAWLGVHAVNLAQQAMDGRAEASPLVRRVWAACGSDRESLQAWCGNAGQFAYAQLAPAVFDCEASDSAAAALLSRAVSALDATALALDAPGHLPLAVLGSVGKRLAHRLSPEVRRRCVTEAAGPAAGALTLIRREIETDR